MNVWIRNVFIIFQRRQSMWNKKAFPPGTLHEYVVSALEFGRGAHCNSRIGWHISTKKRLSMHINQPQHGNHLLDILYVPCLMVKLLWLAETWTHETSKGVMWYQAAGSRSLKAPQRCRFGSVWLTLGILAHPTDAQSDWSQPWTLCHEPQKR